MIPSNILIFHTGSLGDTLVAVPALWAVRENFPDAHITMLTDQQHGRHLVQVTEVLDGAGLIDDYIFYSANRPVGKINLLIQLIFRKFDTLIYLIRADSNNRRINRDKFFFRLSGIKQYIGMDTYRLRPIGKAGSLKTPVPRVADILLDRLRAGGLRTPKPGRGRVDVNVGERENEHVKRWLSNRPSDGGRPWLAIGLGSKMPIKIWPYERYLDVVKHLIEKYDLWPVVFGGPEDRSLGEKFTKELGCGYVMAGGLGIRDSMAAMQRCLLFIGNDTGTMHMAVAAGVRCVAIFSARDYPGNWYPYGEGHVVFRKQVPCEGCMLEVCAENGNACIRSISADEVSDACEAMLRKALSPRKPLPAI